MPSGRAIGVVSRAPTPGNVKSRLAADLGDATAATLYAAFLRDALVNAASIPNSRVRIYHPPDDDPEMIQELCPPGVEIRIDRGEGYGQILPRVLEDLLAEAPVAALVGADSPGLPVETLEAAFEALEAGTADVALCPTTDGGFCLLAVNDHYPDLFQDIDWGTERVCVQMLENARRNGLRVATMPEWYDVDTMDDLTRLASDLAGDVTIGAAATRTAFRALRDSGVSVPARQPPWRIDARNTIHRTPWRTLISDQVTTHTGASIDYTYLETDMAVWIVPVTDAGRIILVRQYRHPIGEIILEVPAGSGSEAPLVVAQRELQEETGGVAREWIVLASHFPAAAHVTHSGHTVVALGVEIHEPELESTELLEVVTVPIDLAVDMARRGEIADSQSALAILAAEPVIRARLGRRFGSQQE